MRFRLRFNFLLLALAFAVSFVALPAKPADAPPSPPPAGAPDVPTDMNHVMHPQDVIRVQVFQEDEINKQCERLEVSQDYTITLPLIGILDVKGKSVRQVQDEIRRQYDKEYIVNPQVTVLVVEYADRWVNVIGSVTKQGKVQFPDVRDLSIVDAIALAGGQTRLADMKHVKLTRHRADGSSELREIDVDAIMKENGGQSVNLEPGDILYVPERML